ncbi:hypothetical protein [Phytobacter massiliensis]|uniref:hypothetical protein n=1 Tax=Phytobacter massiliensis TaxID=1485952 RepID=UPI0002D9F934|nr:hypothetical protein [Phytobacter massiliensis]
MLNKTLESIRYLSEKFIRDKIHANNAYNELKWNDFEKIVVSGSVHYIKAIIILIAVFSALFVAMICGETYIKPLAAEWFPEWETLFNAQLSLLGGQLTIIGIVYPMVVGLVSVIFQRKSARKIVQAAYQTYSGFMLAGLSGLFLSGFILTGIILRTFIGNYNYAIICGITIIWMMLNIALSIWFFVQSLSMLDDQKRERLVLRYLTADVLSTYVKEQLFRCFITAPVSSKIILNENYSHVSFKDFCFDEGYQIVRGKSSPDETVMDMYVRPLKFILRIINICGVIKKKEISIALISYMEGGDKSSPTPLFKVKDIVPDNILIRLMKGCFRTGITARKNIPTDRIIKGLMGDAADALASNDINAFDEAVDGFCRDITAFTDAFNFKDFHHPDNLLLLSNESAWDRSFSEKLYTEIYHLFRQAIIRTDMSERFYISCMWVPQRLCAARTDISLKEIKLGLQYTFYAWEILIRWGDANAARLDITQRQSYDAMLREFVAVWERWTDTLESRLRQNGDQQLYHQALKAHLFTLPQIVTSAVISGESGAVSWAVDMMNRWLHEARIATGEQHTGLYHWQDFFITQSVLEGKIQFSSDSTPGKITANPAKLFAPYYKNMLTDIRLLTAAYLIREPASMLNSEYRFAINTLLSGEVVENTGGLETLSEKLQKSSDVIDVFIRILTWDERRERDSKESPGNIIRQLSTSHGQSMISGRVYMGNRLSGISDLVSQVAELAVILSSKENSVSQKMKSAVSVNLFDFDYCTRIIHRLEALQRATDKLTGTVFVDDVLFGPQRQSVSDLVGKYLNVFNDHIKQSIIHAPVSKTVLEELERDISDSFKEKLHQALPFSLFEKISEHTVVTSNIICRFPFETEKQDVTDRFRRKIHGRENAWASGMFSKVLLDLLSLLTQQPAQSHHEFTSFSDLVRQVASFEGLQHDDYLIICDSALYEQYNEYRVKHLDRADSPQSDLFYDDHRTLRIHGEEQSCIVYIRPHFSNSDTILVNKRAFAEFKIKKDAENIFSFSAEEEDTDELHIRLHTIFEGEAVFSGEMKARFIFRQAPDQAPMPPG